MQKTVVLSRLKVVKEVARIKVNAGNQSDLQDAIDNTVRAGQLTWNYAGTVSADEPTTESIT